MEEFKDLEFLSTKSKELIDKQITSYRQKHSNSGTITTILALFIPFFLNGLENSFLVIKLLALIPIGFLLLSIILLIQVLRSKPLDQGFHVDKFDDLIHSNYEDILLYEIGANTHSFKDNQLVTKKANYKYDLAIQSTVISIVISTLLLVTNEFYKPKQEPTEIIILKTINMKNESKSSEKNVTVKPREIPFVPPRDRTNLNENIDNKPKPFMEQDSHSNKK